MNGFNFTERVRKVLQFAREEAVELHHEYVGTEHMLPALCREGEMEIPEGDAQQRFAAMVNPPVSAIMTCKNVFVVYWEQHGETFKF